MFAMTVLAVLWALPLCPCPHCFSALISFASVAEAQVPADEHSCCSKTPSPSSGDHAPMHDPQAPGEDGCDCSWDVNRGTRDPLPAAIAHAPVSPTAIPPVLLEYESAATAALPLPRGPDLTAPSGASLVANHVLLLI